MTRMKFDAALIGLALVLAAGMPGPAGAQSLPGGASTLRETHGDWIVACRTVAPALRCAVSQTQVNSQNRQRVLSIELSASKGAKTASGVLVLPFGLRLDGGVTLAIDDGKPLPALRFSTCLPAGCLVPLSFDAPTLKALQAGKALSVRAIANDSGQEQRFSVSLTGFGAAWARFLELSPA